MTEILHARARSEVSCLKAKGAVFDKKLLRFNDIVAVAERYETEGAGVLNGLREAIESCTVDDLMHVKGRGPLTLLEQFELSENH